MRAIWKGNISFALVSIPISLFSATRRNELSFHYLHKKDMSPVSYKRFCDTENVDVPWEEITKGYEYEKGQYVEITDEDLDKAEISKKEMDLANMLINSMSDKFDPKKYKDDYYDKVLEIIRMKVAGVSPTAPAAQGPGPAKVIDLMEVLKQSLSETKKAKAVHVDEDTVVAGNGRSGKTTRTRKAK